MLGVVPADDGLSPPLQRARQAGWFLSTFVAVPAEVFADGAEGLVFDARSGDTHYLTPASWFVMSSLRRRPLEFDELCRDLDSAIELDGSESIDALTRRILDELQRMRLVTSAGDPIRR